VTEAHRCEKLAQGFNAACPAETQTHDLLIASPTLYHRATTPPKFYRGSQKVLHWASISTLVVFGACATYRKSGTTIILIFILTHSLRHTLNYSWSTGRASIHDCIIGINCHSSRQQHSIDNLSMKSVFQFDNHWWVRHACNCRCTIPQTHWLYCHNIKCTSLWTTRRLFIHWRLTSTEIKL